ncbi:MAG TPA: cyclic nucleotide-binding domain-containing protein [Candidatus Limnocylindrales bacterium]
MEARALTSILGYTWFGADLSPHARERLAAVGRVVDLPAGAVVVQEGKPCEAMGVVLDGRVALRLAVPGLGDRTILTVESGDVFGWSAAFAAPTATSTCVTTTPTTAILFEREGLLAALEADPVLGAAVYRRLLGALSRRLSATRMQLLDLYRTAVEPW